MTQTDAWRAIRVVLETPGRFNAIHRDLERHSNTRCNITRAMPSLGLVSKPENRPVTFAEFIPELLPLQHVSKGSTAR